ncbi:hypothetical protein MKX03_011018, partial [Papaver bracteatum]
MNEMNGKIIGRKPLCCCGSEHNFLKLDHLLRCHLCHQVLLHTILEDLDLLILNRLYFSQGGPGLFPQPAAYGFQPQLLSGMSPGVSPNFMMPYPLHQCLYRIIYLYVSNSCHSVYQEESVQRPISAFYDLYDIF